MSELIMIRSFSSLALWVRTRIPSEQTFSVVVRSGTAGSKMLEICNGTATRTRFSSLPDPAGICEITFPTGLCWLAPGWAEPKKLQEPARIQATMMRQNPQRPLKLSTGRHLHNWGRSPALVLVHGLIGLGHQFFNRRAVARIESRKT